MEIRTASPKATADEEPGKVAWRERLVSHLSLDPYFWTKSIFYLISQDETTKNPPLLKKLMGLFS